MSVLLCILAFVAAAYVGRKSLVGGVVTALAVGYFYGIARANVNELMSHFIFDGAVIGLYVGRAVAMRRPETIVNTVLIRPWLILLSVWPLLLSLLPIQDHFIQLVGLRGNVFLLPMVLIGAQMDPDERHRMSYYIALLNIIVFGFALAEFTFGIGSFYPRNEITDLIYRSRVDDGGQAFRIPATFTGSHAYAGTMVCTLPLLVEAWASRSIDLYKRYFIVAGIVTATLGVFMAASRTHAVVLFILIIVGTLSFQMRPAMMGLWLSIIVVTGWFVFQDERLQRFATLRDTDAIAVRLGGSVNANFTTAVLEFPMGNGIGAGGTSIPYFLSNRLENPLWIENEYARIQLELGLPGLLMWFAFILWLLSNGFSRTMSQRNLGRRLAFTATVAYLFSGLTGTGLVTSIPQSVLVLFFFGWIVRYESPPIAATRSVGDGLEPRPFRQAEVLPR